MNTSTLRTMSVSALLIGSLGATVVVAPASSAYPPGTAMTLASSTITPKQGAYVTLTASQAKPGCYVTFSSSSRYFKGGRKKANSAGVAALRTSFEKYGTFVVRATTTSGKCGGESATLTFYVSKAPRHR